MDHFNLNCMFVCNVLLKPRAVVQIPNFWGVAQKIYFSLQKLYFM